jgi:hypothetical protein
LSELRARLASDPQMQCDKARLESAMSKHVLNSAQQSPDAHQTAAVTQ